MPNWNEPATLNSLYVSFVNLQHVIAGVYFWEFISHLDFDRRLICRHWRRFSWTPWLYIMSRITAVAALATIIAGNDIKHHEINCTWLSSALIAVRVIAIWNRSPFVVVFVIFLMLGLAGTFVHATVLIRGNWDSANPGCHFLESRTNLPITTAALTVDLLYLLVMLAGLLRRRDARHFGLWQLLWKQASGIIWILLSIMAEAPAVTLVALNLDAPMNMMLLAPQVDILLIGATHFSPYADYDKF
ncbi:hypothetical protein OF83DRAFT_1168449 [Amylostereum chailletii]|nr:hypothetical protein OF83DRAFT_1168449 [Amylostereum chailletii]